MSDTRPIALFDSGIGGLSILLKIKKKLPYENLIYFADQAYFPYGTKSDSQLYRRSKKISEFLFTKNIKMLIVACNTATLHTVSTLRIKSQIPIVGVVPAIKTASQQKSKKIGIMATQSTFKSKNFKNLVDKFANNKEIIRINCNGLEKAIEKNNVMEIRRILKKSLPPVKKSKIDTIVLGCTHYPLIKNEIKKITGSGVKIIDSHSAIAKRVSNLLKFHNSYSSTKKTETFFTTGKVGEFSKIASSLLKYKVIAEAAKI